ncbi:MAG TPA: phosphatase PAP2 family protein [Anaeromyxobacteraceae bacterium]|nr:phosphatase PAP2 family protein [Anaeromyxobacteraceae bacterium]
MHVRRATLSLLLLAALPGTRAGEPTPQALAAVEAPPAPGSDGAKADLAIVLWEQRVRTPSQVRRAARNVQVGLANYAGALGSGFDASAHPLTDELLARAGKAGQDVVRALKVRFARPRPFVADPQVKPAIETEAGYSFPSGHATRGTLFAVILSRLAPAHRTALLECGLQIGYDRVVGGLHYPSDVLAGQRLGKVLAEAWLADPANAAALEDVRAKEWPAPASGPTREVRPSPRRAPGRATRTGRVARRWSLAATAPPP